jgi:hypothetical protein
MDMEYQDLRKEDRGLVDWVVAQVPRAVFVCYIGRSEMFSFNVQGRLTDIYRDTIEDAQNRDAGQFAKLEAGMR